MTKMTIDLGARVLAVLCVAITAACVADDAPEETDTDPGDGTTMTTSGPMTGPTSSPTTNPTPPGTETDTDPDPGTDTDVGTTTLSGETDDTEGTTTGEPEESCFDWTAPPGDCEPRGDAHAVVLQGDAGILPELDEEPCTVVSIESASAQQDVLTLDCGEPYDLRVRSESPHLELPLSADQDVLVSAHAGDSYWVTGDSPSFVIRSTEGEILVVWVNPITVLGAEVDVDIAPLSVTVEPSGCAPTFHGECAMPGAEGTNAIQASILEVATEDAPLRLFGGSSAVVPVESGELTLVVETVDVIVCAESSCIDDSGPYSRLSFLAVATAGG